MYCVYQVVNYVLCVSGNKLCILNECVYQVVNYVLGGCCARRSVACSIANQC
jgi:hypothetical protein